MVDSNISLGTFEADVKLLADGTFDVYLSHSGSSGENYKNVSSDRIGELVADDIECIAENYGNIAKDMSLSRAKELLDRVVEHETVGRNCKDAIKHILWLGFTKEELIREFNFNLRDVADAEEDMDEYEED